MTERANMINDNKYDDLIRYEWTKNLRAPREALSGTYTTTKEYSEDVDGYNLSMER